MMRILLIEDCDKDIEAFKSSVEAWNIGKPEPIVIEECKSLEDSWSKLLTVGDLDGIVLDLKLPNDKNGKEVVKRLNMLYWRIPVVVLTGTPSEDNDACQEGCLKTFIKGEQEHKVILDLLWDCKRSGLMELLGGKGVFEKYLKTVFDKCITPRFDEWRSLLTLPNLNDAEDATQAALSRHVVSCLLAMLQQDDNIIQPEECYLLLPDENLVAPRPGMILENKQKEQFLLLNPPCDLAIRSDGHSNSNMLLLVPITPQNAGLKSILIHPKKRTPLDDDQKAQNKVIRDNAYKNNGPLYFHWLPACGKFQGGFVNFRGVITCAKTLYKTEYHMLENKYVVHPELLKNIQSRFANYYARQGQPDIDYLRFSSEPIEGLI